jgi:hypothetical protein
VTIDFPVREKNGSGAENCGVGYKYFVKDIAIGRDSFQI